MPIGSAPSSTRIAPNHMTATVERLKIAKITGLVSANSRLDAERGVEEVEAGGLEPRLLVARAHEGADDAHAGERLAHHLVDPVDLRLGRPEQRDRPAHDEPDDERHQRQDDDQQSRTAGRPCGGP